LEGVPFMPEMLRYCGEEFPVRARAHKVCDTIEWNQYRRMENAVHLAELRCDGSAHGGCDAGCLPLLKGAWFTPGQDRDDFSPAAASVDALEGEASISEEDLVSSTEVGVNDKGQTLYSCQATEVLRATEGPLKWWEPTQYVEDVKSGNSTVPRVVRALMVGAF